MFKVNSNKSDKGKTSEEEALEILKKLTEELLKTLDRGSELRQKADEFSSMMTRDYSEDSDIAKNMKFAVRVLMVTDVIDSVGAKFEDISDVKTALVMTARTVFGLSTMEAVLFADDIGETAFKALQEIYQDGEEPTAVDKTLCMLDVCLHVLENQLKED
nr:MAG TPA: hypothetical protein [Caudoviricetes sp.]